MGDWRTFSGQTAFLAPQGAPAEFRYNLILDELCHLVAQLSDASIVAIGVRNPKKRIIALRGTYGTTVRQFDIRFGLQELDPDRMPILSIPDLKSHGKLAHYPITKILPNAHSFVAMLLPGLPKAERAMLQLINPGKHVFDDKRFWRTLSSITSVAACILRLEAFNGHAESDAAPSPQGTALDLPANIAGPAGFSEAVLPPPVNSLAEEAVESFLLDTLLKKRSLNSRNGVDYFTLRSWRAPLKPYQLKSLTALKREKPASFVQNVAKELAHEALQLHGIGVIKGVVPMPGGSSGERRSFSVVLGEAVACLLGVPLFDVLQPQGQKGSSSPRKSGLLKPYVVEEKPAVDGPLLLIDDVASSGRHIELAVKALRQSNPVIYSMAWVGA